MHLTKYAFFAQKNSIFFWLMLNFGYMFIYFPRVFKSYNMSLIFVKLLSEHGCAFPSGIAIHNGKGFSLLKLCMELKSTLCSIESRANSHPLGILNYGNGIGVTYL